MMFVFEMAALVAVGVTILMVVSSRRRTQAADALIAGRVDAYTATIRREGGPLDKLGPVELTDLLTMSARNLRLQSERRWLMMVLGAVLGFFSAIFVGTQQGTQGFVLTLLVSAAVLYGLYQYAGRLMAQALERQGIDPDRLRVE